MARRRKKKTEMRHGKIDSNYGLLWFPVVLFFVLLAGLAVFYVWEHIRLREISRNIIQLSRAKQVIEDENAHLRAEAEELCGYRRIYHIARDRFGFVELKPKVIVVPKSE